MRLPSAHGPLDALEPLRAPNVDALRFHDLYRKSEYVVETADGWSLVITRYQPRRQDFHQPLWMEPLLLVHGFSQNRHAWTSGEFVKNLLFFGIDIHILELRGHGKSSIARQRRRAARRGTTPPEDLDYGWNVDSYFAGDLPAAVAAVKRKTGRDRIFYCGHSMGGMLGYGYAGENPDDLAGLITIGSAAELGKGLGLLRFLCLFEPAVGHFADAVLATYNAEQQARHARARLRAGLSSLLGRQPRRPIEPPQQASMPAVPMDRIFRAVDWLLGAAERRSIWAHASRGMRWLSNPSRTEAERFRWLLRNGGEREPRAVVSQFARWIRNEEMKCYRTGYDFKEGYARIAIPTAIIFGDMDPLATLDSTQRVYHDAKSEYLLWRPVKGNSHIELTMGHDIRQICYDIKNLIEYARSHESMSPSLPRVH